MNTFFSAIQLFFESGYSCTIDCDPTQNVKIGLDPALRFRMTDCTHEEDGCVTTSILPPKFKKFATGLAIEEAQMVQRTSIALKTLHLGDVPLVLPPGFCTSGIVNEKHTVFGLKLKGLEKMAYVWARAEGRHGQWTWVNVRIHGLRNDVPLPPESKTKPGAQVTVVVKDSLIGPCCKKQKRST